MSVLASIQSFVQEYAVAISEILELEVTIVDENLIRVGGTGLYLNRVGDVVPAGSYFDKILKTGDPIVLHDAKNQDSCRNCPNSPDCSELATLGFPILIEDKPVGVIGIIAFTGEQRAKIVNSSGKLQPFLKHMSNLLGSKIMLTEYNRQLQQEVQAAMKKVSHNNALDCILGSDPAFCRVIEKAQNVADSNSTVLIRGESGTGKELLARAIHALSRRKNRPFVALNCASIPEQLLESELFGYRAGAFTGAHKAGKGGKFELAQHGTIFLDEVGDMPLSLQPKLLRVLQEKTIDPIGGGFPIRIDVRIIAATNKNLEAMISQGRYREDLYYRLNVIPIDIPPLRDRPMDIPIYTQYFLDKFAKLMCKGMLTIETDLLHWMQTYHWPGNVRQLENVMEYMVNVSKKSILKVEDLPAYLLDSTKDVAAGGLVNLGDKVSRFEQSILQQYVTPNMTTEEKRLIARKFGISLATLYRKIRKG